MADTYDGTTSLEEWIEGGSWNNTDLKDVADDPEMENYYTNYKNVVDNAIADGDLGKAQRTVEAHGFEWSTPSSSDDDETQEIVYEPPDRPSPHDPEERPDYEGPEYYDPRTFDPTPGYMKLREINDEDYLSNRIASLLRQDGKLFRMFSESAARKFGNRGPRAQEMMMGEIMKVAKSIGEAEALMLERDRTLHNTAYYKQMDIRMQGAMQQALSHIAGGYQIQATIINDITNQWKAQLAADTQVYGIDVSSATSIYATKIQEALGLKGLDVKMAEVLSNIEDNAEATAFLWDMVYGDNDLNPSEWLKKWKEKYGDIVDTDTETANTGTDVNRQSISNMLNASPQRCNEAARQAKAGGSADIAFYNANRGSCPIISTTV